MLICPYKNWLDTHTHQKHFTEKVQYSDYNYAQVFFVNYDKSSFVYCTCV